MLFKRLSTEIAACCLQAGLPAQDIEVLRSQRSDLGQFQINAAMTLTKVLRRPPRAIAEEIAAQLRELPHLRDVRVDGPGFINFSLTESFLSETLGAIATDPRQGIAAPAVAPGRVVLDYGGPNVAKAMHVGHLRSAIIGDTLRRLSVFLGYDVVADIHLGDWGLPMGMVIGEIFERFPELQSADPDMIAHEWSGLSIDALNEIYPAASARCKSDAAVLERARQLTVALQAGEPASQAIWKRITAVSIEAARHEFGRLNAQFDLWQGESHVHGRLLALIAALRKTDVTEVSDGALVIRVPDSAGNEDIPPLILEKSEGGVMYAGTDLAAIADRVETLDPDFILYVVDQRQHLHFEQVFRAAARIGLTKAGRPALEHVGFGTINGPDGKPFKTRSGGVLKLGDLIDQGAAAAKARFGEMGVSGDLSGEEVDELAGRLSIATIRFADLANNRRSDYVFNLERFSAAEGRTGPYLCYGVVRACAILRKAAERGILPGRIGGLSTEAEQALALQLLAFPSAVNAAWDKRLPSILCDHLFELGQLFNAFYHQQHILSEPDAGRQGSLLALTAAVEAQMRLGLTLLGIDAPTRM